MMSSPNLLVSFPLLALASSIRRLQLSDWPGIAGLLLATLRKSISSWKLASDSKGEAGDRDIADFQLIGYAS
nr:uncharacterized protein CTRU02_15734 [Colletotrichum truncatum]XP_036578832.1 uncharacterized protein CTRU02_11086 [Colletotrichum truncatum]KAF6780706.1 hypothetical protein CTRU02_15734 [Colletotrichum truncatum]KAF6786215.1 hypothetical protein CTRU02_11086 [Colletotrichum truncatum]